MTVGWRAIPRILLPLPLNSERIARGIKRSLFVRHIDGGSSNIVEAELTSLMGPVYNLARYGVRIVASPSHADVLLLTGPLTRNMLAPAQAAFAVMPAPKAIVTVGDFANVDWSAEPADPLGRQAVGVFAASYATVDLPPDMRRAVVAHVAGDPPEPQAICQVLLAVAKARARWWRRGRPIG